MGTKLLVIKIMCKKMFNRIRKSISHLLPRNRKVHERFIVDNVYSAIQVLNQMDIVHPDAYEALCTIRESHENTICTMRIKLIGMGMDQPVFCDVVLNSLDALNFMCQTSCKEHLKYEESVREILSTQSDK